MPKSVASLLLNSTSTKTERRIDRKGGNVCVVSQSIHKNWKESQKYGTVSDTLGARREIRYEVDLLPFLLSFYSISRDGLTLHLHPRKKKKKKKIDNKESDCADEV